MADLNERAVSGRIFERCYHLEITNPLSIPEVPEAERGTPVIRFNRERITIIGERVLREAVEQIERPFDPVEQIPMRDLNGELTGETTTALAAYLILSSYFYKVGADAAPAA